MSGGSFDYAFRHVDTFIADLERRLHRPHEHISPKMRASLKELLGRARQLARDMHTVEWYFSGDIGEEIYFKRIKEDRCT